MKAYSEDLRQKIVDALKRGMPNCEAATLFGMSLSSVKRFARDGARWGLAGSEEASGQTPKEQRHHQETAF